MLPPLETIKALLIYDGESGLFHWRHGALGNDARPKPAGTKGKRGYIAIGIKGRVYQAHRLAWLYHYGEQPPNCIDHIDRNTSNNAISNLRAATHAQNCANRSVSAKNKCRAKGVHWNEKVGKWRAQIRVRGTLVSLGCHSTIEQAADAYDRAAKQYFGDYASGSLLK